MCIIVVAILSYILPSLLALYIRYMYAEVIIVQDPCGLTPHSYFPHTVYIIVFGKVTYSAVWHIVLANLFM